MIHRLIATILTGLLLAIGLSQLGCGKPSTVQQIGMSIWIVLLVVFAVITISFAFEKSRDAAQRCVYAWMVFAAIVGGLLISFGCKSPAPGPTQTPEPVVQIDFYVRCTPCGDEWDCQLHDSMGNTHGLPFCGRSGQTWATTVAFPKAGITRNVQVTIP